MEVQEDTGSRLERRVKEYRVANLRARRRGMMLASGLLVGASVGCGALAMQMSDIGHAVGFAGAAGLLFVGAVVVLWHAR